MSQDQNDFQQSPYPQQSQQYASQPQAYGQGGYPAAEDPGKTLGIVGFVLAFVFAPAGLIISAIAKKKSREAGFPVSGLAKWGFILGIIFTIFLVLYIVLVVVVGVAAVQSGAY